MATSWSAAMRRMVVSSMAATTCSALRLARVRMAVAAVIWLPGLAWVSRMVPSKGARRVVAARSAWASLRARRFLSRSAWAVARALASAPAVELGAGVLGGEQGDLGFLDGDLGLGQGQLVAAGLRLRQCRLRIRQCHLALCDLSRRGLTGELPLSADTRQVGFQPGQQRLPLLPFQHLFQIGLVLAVRGPAVVLHGVATTARCSAGRAPSLRWQRVLPGSPGTGSGPDCPSHPGPHCGG